MSSQFGHWERRLARVLSRTPTLKKLIKKSYQRASSVLFRPSSRVETVVPISDVAPDEVGETFFGYFDKSPENLSAQFILFHQTNHTTKELPDPTRPIKVVCMRIKDNQNVFEFPTAAYNWQQGSRLQWITDSSFIFNDFDHEQQEYVSRMVDLTSSNSPRTLRGPVNDVFGTEYYLSLSYQRLGLYAPDYGYRNLIGAKEALKPLERDGVFIGSMERDGNNSMSLLVSLKTIMEVQPHSSMQGADHTLNHIAISPDGSKFHLIHRWYRSGKRYDRLLMISRDGSDIRVLADQAMVSHVVWLNPETVAGYFRNRAGEDGYFKIDVENAEEESLVDSHNWIYGDGHPTFFEKYMVTDTYPDRSRLKSLIHIDFHANRTLVLGKFFEDVVYDGETRCDLHPRFSPSGRCVYFDSVHTGRRRLYRALLAE